MARMRMLKPGFFSNDQLAKVSPLGRLLFQGLWCLADKEGRLEDRPARIKAEVLPYDKARVDQLLGTLAELGFIERYEIDGRKFIQVVKFKKHQSPNVKEAESTIPAPCMHGESTVPPPDDDHPSTASRAGVLGNRNSNGVQEQELKQETPIGVMSDSDGEDVERSLFEYYKTRVQPKARQFPRKKICARLKRFSVEELRLGIDHFAGHPWWMQHNAQRGADWFFESDTRAEQFLLMTPESEQPKSNGLAPPVQICTCAELLANLAINRNSSRICAVHGRLEDRPVVSPGLRPDRPGSAA